MPKPVKTILSLYGAVHSQKPPPQLWTKSLPHIAAKLPSNLSESFLNRIYKQKPIPTDSSVSLEGQTETGVSKGPEFSKSRDAFAFTQIASGTVLSTIYPESRTDIDPEFREVDPIQKVSSRFSANVYRPRTGRYYGAN